MIDARPRTARRTGRHHIGIATSLQVLDDIKISIHCDSALSRYTGVKEKGKGVCMTGVPLVCEHHPHRYINVDRIQSGASCLDIRQGPPTGPREIESDDVTIVVCMFNKLPKKDYTKFTEGSRHAADTRDLCLHLRRSWRPVLVLGGTAALWSMSEEWDFMVARMVNIAMVNDLSIIHLLSCRRNS